jgi:hypothetical protein
MAQIYTDEHYEKKKIEITVNLVNPVKNSLISNEI